MRLQLVALPVNPSPTSRISRRVIVPLTHETKWMKCLAALPAWDSTAYEHSTDLLVIAPHPDDETLGAGGFIASQCSMGADVRVVAVTDGEKAYGEEPGQAEVRVLEQERALARLGVRPANITRLHLPDSDVASHEQQLVELLMPLVTETTHIVAPWTGDFHPDHEACGRAAEEVARRSGAKLTWYFFWTWHRGTTECVADLPLHTFALKPEFVKAKAAALAEHRSQLEHASGNPILPENLLGPARRNFEVFAPAGLNR
jgi:LmbE family N-acetylglucosaminyl deacetylase